MFDLDALEAKVYRHGAFPNFFLGQTLTGFGSHPRCLPPSFLARLSLSTCE